VDEKVISPEDAEDVQPEINIAMCNFCTLWQKLLLKENGFPYDIVLPSVSEAGFELSCDCSLGTSELHWLRRNTANLIRPVYLVPGWNCGPRRRVEETGPFEANSRVKKTAIVGAMCNIKKRKKK
jgi:hypothetical protein